MDNEIKETKKGIGALGIFLIVLLCVGITAPSAWYLGKKMGEKDNQQQVDNKNNNVQKESNNNTNNNTKKDVVKEVLFDNTSYGNDVVDIVELTEDGKILVTIKGNRLDDKKEVIKEEIINSVNKTYKVHAGESDVCEGNSRLMFIMNDGTISYLDIDQLVCGDDIVTANNIANLKDIVEITEKITPGKCEKFDNQDWCLPDHHDVYALDKSGNQTDITNFLIPNRN